jgi:hypothetical protein
MARGASGKIVIEIDPELKAQIYLALERRRLNMKTWIEQEGRRLVALASQPELFQGAAAVESRPPRPYR